MILRVAAGGTKARAAARGVGKDACFGVPGLWVSVHQSPNSLLRQTGDFDDEFRRYPIFGETRFNAAALTLLAVFAARRERRG